MYWKRTTLRPRREKRPSWDERLQRASRTMLRSLADESVMVVWSVFGNRFQMVAKGNTKMSERLSLRYWNPDSEFARHISHSADFTEPVRGTVVTIEHSLAIGILIASIEVPHLLAVTAAIKTLTERQATSETVSERLMDRFRKPERDAREYENIAEIRFTICNRMCNIEDWWLNPNNRKYLSLSPEKAQFDAQFKDYEQMGNRLQSQKIGP